MSSVQIEQKTYEMPPREGISIAHFLTVADIQRSARYYEKVFGARILSLGDGNAPGYLQLANMRSRSGWSDQIQNTCSTSRYGSCRSRTPYTTLKIAVVVPTANATVTTAPDVKRRSLAKRAQAVADVTNKAGEEIDHRSRDGDPRPRLIVGRKVRISTVVFTIKRSTPPGSACSLRSPNTADRLGRGRSRT
jgi:hypothetical protein